jgi:serine/threonine protein kinase
MFTATEYGAGNVVSTNGDIYSYGILVLETVTGKKPTDTGFRQGLTLREYVELGLDDRVIDIVDTQLSFFFCGGWTHSFRWSLTMDFRWQMILSIEERLIGLLHYLDLECLALRNCHQVGHPPEISSRNCMQ